MKTEIKDKSIEELHLLLDNYQQRLLEENSVLSDSTKLLGNDKITEIITELRKREKNEDNK